MTSESRMRENPTFPAGNRYNDYDGPEEQRLSMN